MPLRKFITGFLKWNEVVRFSMVLSIIYLGFGQYKQNQRIQDLQTENVELKKVNSEIIANQISSTRILDRIKKPIWQKAKRGRRYTMQVLNKPFEVRFLKPYGLDKYDYYGQTDYNIFPFNAAKQFNKGDSLASTSEESINYTETFMDSKGEKITVDVMKWREITVDKDTLIWGMIR